VVQLPKILDRLATAGKGGVDSNSTGDGIAVASQELLQEEVDCALSLPDPIRLTFVGGRLAMRRALMCFGVSPPPILRNSHGAPQLPASFMGSISHKRTVAVAVAAPRVSLDGREWPRNIGVDIEMLGGAGRRRKLGQRVLREDEIRGLGSIPGVSEDDEVLLRFSLKEAIYKALHPHVRRLVSFKEAAVHPSESGKCRVDLSLANQEGPFRADAAWRRLQIPSGPGNALEDYVLTWAVIEPQI
jgi:enterobactin synthetase component D